MTALAFDLIIYGFLLFDLIIIGSFILGWIRIGKKSFTIIPIFVFCFMLLAGATVFYGSFIEPKLLTVTTYSWKQFSPELFEKMGNMRFAIVSDFHLGPYKKKAWIEKTARKLEELNPDIILLLGDFIFERYEPTDDFEPLKTLRPRLGMYAVWGNHDYGETLDELRNKEGKKRIANLRKTLEKAGIKILVNESVIFPEAPFMLGGIDEIWTLHADIPKTFGDFKEPSVRILAAHNPDAVKAAIKYPVDFVIAGHTHSGQIRLPFWGSIPQIPTKLGNRFDEGIFYFDRFDGKKLPLAVTRGIGESGPKARLFAPPEIMIIE